MMWPVNSWDEWLMGATRGESSRSIAGKTKYSYSAISGWRRSGRPPADAVLRIAQVYDGDIIGALRASGWLTDHDYESIVSVVRREIPTRVLIEELHSRAQFPVESDRTDPNMLLPY